MRNFLLWIIKKNSEISYGYARADNTLKRKALEKADPIKHQKLGAPDWNDDNDLMD